MIYFFGMNFLPKDVKIEVMLYLDKNSQYNLIKTNKINYEDLKRLFSYNIINYIGVNLGLSKSDLYNNFFENFIKLNSIDVLKEMINILEPKSDKIYNLNSTTGFVIRYFKIKKMSMLECMNHILNYNDNYITKFTLKKRTNYYNNNNFKNSLYKNSRNVYSILI